ncbi:MAG: hypothetical protein QQN65_07665, partial [Nitrosopumilus sp.]
MSNNYVEIKDTNVKVAAIQNTLGPTGGEWKCWPDIYAFLATCSPGYVKSHNVTPEGLIQIVV